MDIPSFPWTNGTYVNPGPHHLWRFQTASGLGPVEGVLEAMSIRASTMRFFKELEQSEIRNLWVNAFISIPRLSSNTYAFKEFIKSNDFRFACASEPEPMLLSEYFVTRFNALVQSIISDFEPLAWYRVHTFADIICNKYECAFHLPSATFELYVPEEALLAA